MDKPEHKSLPESFMMIVGYSDGTTKVSSGIYYREKLRAGESMHNSSRCTENITYTDYGRDEMIAKVSKALARPSKTIDGSDAANKSGFSRDNFVDHALQELFELSDDIRKDGPEEDTLKEALDVMYLLAFGLTANEYHGFMMRTLDEGLEHVLDRAVEYCGMILGSDRYSALHEKWRAENIVKYPEGLTAENMLSMNDVVFVQDLVRAYLHIIKTVAAQESDSARGKATFVSTRTAKKNRDEND